MVAPPLPNRWQLWVPWATIRALLLVAIKVCMVSQVPLNESRAPLGSTHMVAESNRISQLRSCQNTRRGEVGLEGCTHCGGRNWARPKPFHNIVSGISRVPPFWDNHRAQPLTIVETKQRDVPGALTMLTSVGVKSKPSIRFRS
jgi:hypothetical protein